MFLICTTQISLFAQIENSYKGKYVEVILKNGHLLKGKVIAESERGIQLAIIGVGSWFVYTAEIKQIKVMTEEAKEIEINAKLKAKEDVIKEKIEEAKEIEKEINRKREALRTDYFEIL